MEQDAEATKVRSWRHMLQKTFLSPGPNAPGEDMPPMDALFTTVEEYPMSVPILKFSKIGKVMRHIRLLDPEQVSRDEEFHFRDRAGQLADEWSLLTSHSGFQLEAERKPQEKPEDVAEAVERMGIHDGDGARVGTVHAKPEHRLESL
ncbi:hypothetical protein B0H16DRAFT_1526963 [Mycena metata]|uniref:Uncharacterized protein n=1 Tax=Mycena metata TaxID=1033252 RepID=A0AAD7JGP4_9AGAR|nr:hypothetical protein B0H16DRAFT_1526963 [Mycena metata]